MSKRVGGKKYQEYIAYLLVTNMQSRFTTNTGTRY